ncbi:ComEA family DNA-binding protein [Bacillus sp. FJAT-42376]|uniref:helix-hairpin-helix domain-containing protein n=1 Tax=Bacillus sp. FJAT-42376 TaxID=2014076 RepID=UPI000F4D4725|nr:helix-hairpin-helix domain-containing protein [Bacillus sp. FJAT-42376]AZB43693.1 ComEA family DNA-binding protein [Bacillus sp. FJAT-42376]
MNWFQKYRFYLIGVIFMLMAAVFLISGKREETENPVPVIPDHLNVGETEEKKAPPGPETKRLLPKPEFMVDVKGAVKRPGVYELWPGARVKDAVDHAGGLLENADGRQVNLASVLSDGSAVYIPLEGEEVNANVPAPSGGGPQDAGKSQPAVNLNTASLEELQTLPGIGPSKAEAILSYREEKGSFMAPEDLKEVSGIGDKTFEKLKDFIQVN